jgi:tetratricopeptide (TPR) repeat protein
VADIFVSYTSDDRDWAFWIGQELLKLGHAAHLHDWEISAGGNIMAWMEERHDEADRVLCVVSSRYLEQPYSALERLAAQWAGTSKRPNFLLPVFLEPCEPPTLFAPLKRCDLHGLNEDQARARFAAFMMPAAKPTGPIPFPGALQPSAAIANAPVPFPGGPRALSNIPITVPRVFLGRDEVLAEIKTALAADQGRVAITALYGMRGVGKTTLAAVYADFHRSDYRATWWIRAETESTMRADLVGLGVRVGWVAPEEKEEPALATVMERLRHEGRGILLIFDNAINADSVESYFPNGGDAQIIITSNAHAWRDVASPMQIDTWPDEIGADYLVSRTGRKAEREAALALSKALGGLPLAHEQAAAYCERLEVPLATYQKRYEAAPVSLLDDGRDAPRAYHNRLTVAKTFALAIDEAAKLNRAAEPLIVYAALLAPEPIPLFLFSEARKILGDPLASALRGNGVDEAIAALRAFALVDRETIADERDPSIKTDCIRLHRLVRQIALGQRNEKMLNELRLRLVRALALIYPAAVYIDPNTWPRARRLDALAMAMVDGDAALSESVVGKQVSYLLDGLASFRMASLAAYTPARLLFERALAIDEKSIDVDQQDIAVSLNNLGYLVRRQGDLASARKYYERSLAIREALTSDDTETATSLDNLGAVLQLQGDIVGAQPLVERALAIREKAFPPDHPVIAGSLNNLGYLRRKQGDFAGALANHQRALDIFEEAYGPNHPNTAICLGNIGAVLQMQGNFTEARKRFERALAIRQQNVGPDHPDTAMCLHSIGGLLHAEGKFAIARPYLENALVILEKVLGADHPFTKTCARDLARLLDTLGCSEEAEVISAKYRL